MDPVSSNHEPVFGHAIVTGCTITGMLAAGVLAQHFAQVTLVDIRREGEAYQPEWLLLRRPAILEQIFPGLLADLSRAGAVSFNMGQQVEWFVLGRWRPRYHSEIESTACSKLLLEGVLLHRLCAHPRVRIMRDHEASGLVIDPDRRRARGVWLRDTGEDVPAREMAADLVVDASDRQSLAADWLLEAGIARVPETVIDALPGFATRTYRRPGGTREAWRMMYVQPTAPASSRGALLLPLEDNRLHLTLIGMGGDHPPADEEGFMAFAHALPTRRVYDAIVDATPLTSIHAYQGGENRLRHYDKLPATLDGFAIIGEAMYALNPALGHSITVAAVSSETLSNGLLARRASGKSLDGFTRDLQEQLAVALAPTCQLALGEDQGWASARGEGMVDATTRLMGRYMAHVLSATLTSSTVLEAFYRVQEMLDPPSLFFRPDIVLQVLGNITRD